MTAHRAPLPIVAKEHAMRLEDFRKSDNVEDRSEGGGASFGGGSFGGGGIRLGGGALILIVIVSLLFGVNPMTLIGGLESVTPPQTQPAPGYGPQYQNPVPAARQGAPGGDLATTSEQPPPRPSPFRGRESRSTNSPIRFDCPRWGR